MKKTFKRIVTFVICVLVLCSYTTLFACGRPDLKVYNCYDYIDEDLIAEFEEYYQEKTGKKIKVQYTCYDTPEILYNELKTKGSDYDVVCPSDYMIEKMAREDMLLKIDLKEDGVYNTNVSPFIKEKFESVKWGDNNELSLSDYAAGYMWGTMGLCYNPDKVDENDLKSWSILWEDKYSGRFSVKDSIRDTYLVGLAKYYETELEANKLLKETDYNAYYNVLKEKFNDTEKNTVDGMENVLKSLIGNAGYTEVDEGKDYIIQGKIDIYLAWSGDAVYAMDCADEEAEDMALKYIVPEEGSNVWFDGWCVPKTAANPDLAREFIEFISLPENAIKNMEYIGYVSCIGGDDVFDWVSDTYGAEEGEEVNLNYFFGKETDNYIVKTDEPGRQFSAQYPDKEVIDRCVLMNYFPTERNDMINKMWIKVVG